MLRPYQTKAIQLIRNKHIAGVSRQLLCMATGTGKSVVFANLPKEMQDILPGQTMLLVHRDELAKQAVEHFRSINPTLTVQQEAGALICDASIADIVVASVQTLGRQGTIRTNKFNWNNISRLIVDEAHRSITNSYKQVFDVGGYLKDNKRLLLGCTATPVRGDGQGLNEIYQAIPFTYSLRQAIDDGWLVDVKGIRVNTKVSLDQVSTKGGEYDEKELAEAIDTPWRNALVAKSYLEHCEGRQAIGFSVNILHAQNLAETFKKKGINAEWVSGVDPEKDDKISRFRKGQIDVLFNAQLLVEGFDCPPICCVIMAAPTKSGVVFSQRVGRGTRLFDGKTDVIVLDMVDTSVRHSLITLPTLLGLPSKLDLKGTSLTKAIEKIEEIQKKYPHLDFTTLDDITKVDSWVTNVNLFEVKIPAEIDANSEFIWHPTAIGGYVLMLPDKDEIRISQNLLDIWELRGKIKGKSYKGERNTLEEALAAADKLVMDVAPDVLKIVQKEAKWHKDPPTPGQLKLLKKLYKNKQIPDNLTKGSVSKLIGSALAGKE
jgi:ATP-dependent helicase IRC3